MHHRIVSMNPCQVLMVLLLFSMGARAIGQSKGTVFQDYSIKEFLFQEKEAKVVVPNVEPNGQWIWRARFWGHEPQTDIALLEKGFHLVYIDVADLFGNAQTVALWNEFYTYCRETYRLNKKVVLEGMSRGGLIIYNWAAKNTDKVACLYADAPVCDIKSWPGGLYNGIGNAEAWQNCLNAHGLDEVSALSYDGIPVVGCSKVAEANIPVLHVCGDADKVVPYEENTLKLKERFEAAGGTIKIILKKGIGHHPHSLKDPKPIVDFILEHTQYEK